MAGREEVSCLDNSHTLVKHLYVLLISTGTRLQVISNSISPRNNPPIAGKEVKQSATLPGHMGCCSPVGSRQEEKFTVRGICIFRGRWSRIKSIETWQSCGKLAWSPRLMRVSKGPFGDCSYKFLPTPINPLPGQCTRMHKLLFLALSWPLPFPRPLPGSHVGKWSWLLFSCLNYSHPNLGHWH